MTRPICIQCNSNLCKNNGISRKGIFKYKKHCSSCEKIVHNQTSGKTSTRKLGYTLYKKDKCEYCGFIPIHTCQLDVDHIDGNKHNNDLNNLMTLCANCHRLKTHKQRSPKN